MVAVALATPAVAQLAAGDVFRLAEEAIAGGRIADAEAMFKALAADPDEEVRSEARFRLGKTYAARGKLSDAAVQYRAILDEKPDAQRVRLELAAILVQMGNLADARRALRQAQAGPLPPDVAQIVDQYSAALRSLKPFGASFEVTLAPSTNINRATTSTTLDTIIAPFELSDDARARSGVGVRLGGQAWVAAPLSPALRATLRLSGQGSVYREARFNDMLGAVEAGLEIYSGRSRFRPTMSASHRWFAGVPYATTYGGGIGWTRALGKRGQIEIEASAARADYRTNDLQDGAVFDATVAVERAFSSRFGGRLSVTAQRQTAADPAYATVSGGITALAWREAGATTVFATLGLSRLEADARLGLLPDRRKDWLTRATGGLSWRRWRLFGFAPVVRVSYERNASTTQLYDYRRFGAEVGLTRAF
jgi:outer membrane protein